MYYTEDLHIVDMLYNVILESFLLFYMLYNYVTVTIICDIMLNSNSRSKNKKIN